MSSCCIDVVLNRSNLLLVMINRLVSFFLKSKLIISISLCFRCVSKFWWLLHTCVCERLTYVPYDGCKLNLIDVLIVFHAIIMILHFFNLTTLTSTEWKKKSSEYCIMFQTCNLIWIWYFSDLCMNTNIFDMKIKNPKPLLRIFFFSATAGKRSRGDVFGAASFCRLTLSACVISELSIPTPLVFKL